MATFQLLRRPKTSIIPHPVGHEPSPRSIASSTVLPAVVPQPYAALNSSLGMECSRPTKGPLDDNHFGKFAVSGNATPLWSAAAQELAEHAAKVTSEGGLEAAIEAPYIYAALDQLASRALRWTTHRAELLEEKVPPVAGSGGKSPEQLGMDAERAVKDLFTAAVDDANAAMQSAARAAAINAEFPSLAPSSPLPARQASAAARSVAPPYAFEPLVPPPPKTAPVDRSAASAATLSAQLPPATGKYAHDHPIQMAFSDDDDATAVPQQAVDPAMAGPVALGPGQAGPDQHSLSALPSTDVDSSVLGSSPNTKMNVVSAEGKALAYCCRVEAETTILLCVMACIVHVYSRCVCPENAVLI